MGILRHILRLLIVAGVAFLCLVIYTVCWFVRALS